jgi:hypothetical protein
MAVTGYEMTIEKAEPYKREESPFPI